MIFMGAISTSKIKEITLDKVASVIEAYAEELRVRSYQDWLVFKRLFGELTISTCTEPVPSSTVFMPQVLASTQAALSRPLSGSQPALNKQFVASG